jgi:site-specific DNA-methyltransferase (cytosine-N4-specific)
MRKPYWDDPSFTLYLGDTLEVLREMPDASVNCIVTSPPYYALRNYNGADGQYGLEPTVGAYVETMRNVFRECRRVLAADGTLWLNLGDSYSGSTAGSGGTGVQSRKQVANRGSHFGSALKVNDLPAKNMLGVPWRVAFALQDDGWILRNEIIWHKPNGMPNSVSDRFCAKHEHVFLFAGSSRYDFNLDAVRERPTTQRPAARRRPIAHTNGNNNRQGGTGTHPNGKNPGDVWSIATKAYRGEHFATFPPELPERCIKAGCVPGGVVLDPFSGTATTGEAALKLGRRYIGIDINAMYHDLAIKRVLNPGGE